ncbi:MAG: hypothetical protein NVSMB29_04370 [Candidatus Dormibacteria bacterium]
MHRPLNAAAGVGRRATGALLLIVPVATACGGTAPAGGGGSTTPGGGGLTSAPAFTLPGGGAGGSSLCRFGGGGDSACYTATLTVTGATSVSGSVTTPQLNRGSCQTWMSKFAAGSSDRGVELPGVTLSNGAGFSASLEGWKGPGSYPLGSRAGTSYLTFGGNGGVTANGVLYSGPVAGATKTAAATAVVQADGSFTVTFSDLADSNNPSRTVSGSAAYTCKTF